VKELPENVLSKVIVSAVREACASPCAKSKRGVATFFVPQGSTEPIVLATGHNAPPHPFSCAGDGACLESCNKICVHAEMAALLATPKVAENYDNEVHLLHIKVVGGEPVPSGPPSCWQCSRMILHERIAYVWLVQDTGLRSYTAQEFHELTLRHCGLPHAKEAPRL
jgi:deoxycytidylate deaminase